MCLVGLNLTQHLFMNFVISLSSKVANSIGCVKVVRVVVAKLARSASQSADS